MTNNDQRKGRWTARHALRLIGAVDLLIAGLMAVLGAFVLDIAAHPTLFVIYWAVFAILLLIALIIAMFDAVATIGRFKKEHAKLHDTFRKDLDGENDTKHQG
jgi:uncharacterized membrane protein